MSTSIIYKDLLGSILTQQQAIISNDYEKEYFIDGNLKKIEKFRDFKLNAGVYFLSETELLSEIVAQFKDIWPKGGQFYFNKQQINEYTLWDWECYLGSVLRAKGKAVFNAQFQFITNQELDIATLEVIETNKYYSLSNFEDFDTDPSLPDYGKLEFIYTPDENIQVLIGLGGFEDDAYTITETKNILYNPLLIPLFSWDNETFYHSAEPLVPGQ